MKTENTDRKLAVRSYKDLIAPALAGIPIIGGPLSASWSQWDTNRRFGRVEQVIEELVAALKSGAYAVDPTKHGEENMQLLEVALQKGQYAHTENKRRLFARLIASAWSYDAPFDEKLLFIKALDDFTEHHLHVLAILAHAGPEAGIPYSRLRDEVVGDLPSVEQDSILVGVLDCLASQYGFIRRAWGLNEPGSKEGGHIMATTNLSAEGIARKCNHTITPLGLRFVAYLDEPKHGAPTGEPPTAS